MAWRRPGDKPLFEPMMVSLPTHIHVCVTRPQRVKSVDFDFYVCARAISAYRGCHLINISSYQYKDSYNTNITASGVRLGTIIIIHYFSGTCALAISLHTKRLIREGKIEAARSDSRLVLAMAIGSITITPICGLYIWLAYFV